jgi:hypothetical protein
MTRALAPLVLAAALVASHADAQPKVRVKVHPGTHLAGQQVRIDVQVLVPNFFSRAALSRRSTSLARSSRCPTSPG